MEPKEKETVEPVSDLREIENLKFAEMKKRRGELVAACKGHPDLEARYVQASMDAKMRDERMAVYGKQIKELEDKCEGLQTKLEHLTGLHDDLKARFERGTAEYEKLQKKNEKLDDRRKELQGTVQGLSSVKEKLTAALEESKRTVEELKKTIADMESKSKVGGDRAEAQTEES